jgi:NTE family protein
MSPEPVAVVVAGAGARGGYEAGVLSVLVPRLRKTVTGPLTFVGTSAGAINAALLGASSHLSPEGQADAVLSVWRDLSVSNVYRSPVLGFPGVAARIAGQLLQVPGVRVTGLLDTAPLRRTARDAVDWRQFRANLDGGRAALAVVTTSGADNRTVVFVDRAPGEPVPGPDDERPIDYLAAEIGPEHVLASAAIPVLFPPVRVPDAGGDDRFYLDGGVRLNAPLKPALSLGAKAVAVVATHPAIDAERPEEPGAGGVAPDVDDTIVRLIDAALVDRMVEDVRTLARVDALVSAGAQTNHEVIPYLLAGPAERGTLGRLAAETFERHRRVRGLRQSEMRVLGHLLLGDGPRRGDLLSFLYFDPDYMEASIELGQHDAEALLAGAGPDEVPWETGPLRPTAAIT